MAKNKKRPGPGEIQQASQGNECQAPESTGIKIDIRDYVILIIILLISFFLRTYGLTYPVRIYFDETHYVPASRAFLSPSQLDPNDVHPPLAKQLMAVFMKIFGDWALGWRAGSVFFGMLMIIAIYFLALSMFKNRYAAAISAGMLGTEFLHIVQSRIATLDIYIAFFIYMGFHFAWLYFNQKPVPVNDKTIRRPLGHLLWSGFFFGLATSVKLSGLGGAAGAFGFLVLALWAEKKRFPVKEAFVIGIVYALTILPVFLMMHIPLFAKGLNPEKLLYFKTFRFHYTEKFTHPYLSQMWQWPTMHRPIWYLWEKDPVTKTLNGIIAMGNLLFWWSFLPVLVDMLVRVFKKKDPRLIFILCGYLSLYLFWLSSLSNYGGHWHLKGGFFYYMTPCVPFMVLALTDTLNDIQDTKLGRVSGWIFLGGLAIFLAAYFPILAGLPVEQKYIDHLMKLNVFKSWM